MKPDASNTAPARIHAIRAGLLCRCPHCGQGPLFEGFLKVVDRCRVCGFDFTGLNTGDGAAVFVMQILYSPPIWVMLVVALPLTLAFSLGLMRPGKGVMVALQMLNKTARHDD